MVLDSSYSILDALTALSKTHNLQKLKIESISNFDMATYLPTVSLSRLKYLEYKRLLNQIELL